MIIDDEHKFVFVHIPKCAGTSFSKILQTWFGKYYFSHYHDEKKNQSPKKIVIDKLSSRLCIHGHFNHTRGEGISDYYPREKQIITIIRDPFDLHVSSYFFVKKEAIIRGQGAFRSGKIHPIILNDWSLKEYLRYCKKSYLCNFLPKNITLENYQNVLMYQFLYIGTVENLQHSIDSLAIKLGFPPIKAPHVNISNWEEVIPQGARAEFEANNKLEFLIYNFVKQIA